MSADKYNLQRFIDAQDPVYNTVCAELKAGHKVGHWMWFVFPQMLGLGSSQMAETYGISSLAEATALMRHPILGERLRHVAHLVFDITGKSVEEIFDYPDYLKFHSSMTLFAQATAKTKIFQKCLDKYYAGKADQPTLALLRLA